MRYISFLLAVPLVTVASLAAPPVQPTPPDEDRGAWFSAFRRKQPMTADEAKAFMKRLARFVHDHHLKTDAESPQRGMTYEYLDMSRKGQSDQFVQGEALDTM